MLLLSFERNCFSVDSLFYRFPRMCTWMKWTTKSSQLRLSNGLYWISCVWPFHQASLKYIAKLNNSRRQISFFEGLSLRWRLSVIRCFGWYFSEGFIYCWQGSFFFCMCNTSNSRTSIKLFVNFFRDSEILEHALDG